MRRNKRLQWVNKGVDEDRSTFHNIVKKENKLKVFLFLLKDYKTFKGSSEAAFYTCNYDPQVVCVFMCYTSWRSKLNRKNIVVKNKFLFLCDHKFSNLTSSTSLRLRITILAQLLIMEVDFLLSKIKVFILHEEFFYLDINYLKNGFLSD